MMLNNTDSWNVIISSDDILNFIVYIGCTYGLIDNKKYSGKESLWPPRSLDTEANIEQWEQWEEWFKEIVRLKVERINAGKHPNTISEEFTPPEFSNVKCHLLKEYCKEAWPKFQEWWYMMAGGKNALAFIEKIVGNKIFDYVNEVEGMLGRKLKPFKLYIDLLYTGVNETIDININNQYIIITSNPISNFDKEWWVKKLYEMGK